jgi:hypothetical protein
MYRRGEGAWGGGWGKGRGSEIEQRVPPTGLLSDETLSKTVGKILTAYFFLN